MCKCVCVCVCVCVNPYSLRHLDALQLQGRLGLLWSGATAMLGLTSATDKLRNTRERVGRREEGMGGWRINGRRRRRKGGEEEG